MKQLHWVLLNSTCCNFPRSWVFPSSISACWHVSLSRPCMFMTLYNFATTITKILFPIYKPSQIPQGHIFIAHESNSILWPSFSARKKYSMKYRSPPWLHPSRFIIYKSAPDFCQVFHFLWCHCVVCPRLFLRYRFLGNIFMSFVHLGLTPRSW